MRFKIELVVLDVKYGIMFMRQIKNCVNNVEIKRIIIPNSKWGLIKTFEDLYGDVYSICIVPINEIEKMLMEKNDTNYYIVGYDERNCQLPLAQILKNKNNTINFFGMGTFDYVNNNEMALLQNFYVENTEIKTDKIVIYIIKTCRFDNSEITQIMLKNELEKEGYNVWALSDDTPPPFMEIDNISEFFDISKNSENIDYYKRFYTEISARDPDIILIRLSSRIRLWEGNANSFNMIYCSIRNIFNPDFCILNLPLNALMNCWLSENEEALSSYMHTKIDCFCINDYYYKLDYDKISDNTQIMLCNEEDLEQLIHDYNNNKIIKYDNINSLKKLIFYKLARTNDII